MFKVALTALAFTFALPAIAAAQAQYSAQDVEAHFSKQTEPAAAPTACPSGAICLPKSKSRAVCIKRPGNPCSNTARPSDTSGGFDLLITFNLGSDRLSAQARQNLTEFARALNGSALRTARFNVDGHTDASGPAEFNLSLSERRAASVVQFLKDLGVDPSRLQAKGHGESSPRISDPYAPINRRVEATIRAR